ncbi:DUF6266 family protein [Pedobacter nutrimenti]|uniref:DUF6266 family protein n=1 Tax=Pedobacter nutrimenti TaxID=1241337 RepID=UPI00292D5AAE|nr:DUF6266 family protein [Pedobacter nutrimenti]
MGILESGLLGPFRNKVGAVIGRRHRGQNVMTGLYEKRRKSNSKKLLEAQEKFALLNVFLSNIDKLVTIGFKQLAKKQSPVNAAFSYNYPHAFVQTDEGILLNYPQICYSKGPVSTPESPAAAANDLEITVTCLAQPQSTYCLYTDLATFLAYCPAKEKAAKFIGVTERHTLNYTMKMPSDFAGELVHCYMSFSSADGKLTGDSIYIGEAQC